jgi:cysteine-rich repeat protein
MSLILNENDLVGLDETDGVRGTSCLAMALLAAIAGSACFQEQRVCESGLVCAIGSECAAAQNVCISDGCGNGIIDRGEECDDGNLRSGDGCSPICRREIAAGGEHNCVIVDGHLVRCWGKGTNGQLGQSSRRDVGDDEPAFADGVHIGGPVKQVAAGWEHTCVLLESGNVRCWGRGELGRPGYGNTDDIGDNEAPAAAGDVSVGGPVKQLAAFGEHTCALLETGAVRCWGWNEYSQLGYGHWQNIGDDEEPWVAGDIDVGGPVKQLAVGAVHTCALLERGAVRCWGWARDGQLGYGNEEIIGDDEVPAAAGDVEVGGLVKQLAAGAWHTCALLETGTVRCWGNGWYGQLGYPNTDWIGDDEVPAAAGDVDLGHPVKQITAGKYHTCALLETGAVRCWGDSYYGQLGYGNTDTIGDDEAPAVAGDVKIGGTVKQLAAGGLHTCALLDTGTVRCWGLGEDGQLGYGNTESIGDNEVPAAAGDVKVGGPIKQLAAGGGHTCALMETGTVRCWGWGKHGQLGYGHTENIGDRSHPASLFGVDLGGVVAQLAAGANHTCALKMTGAVYCWGSGQHGQLGYASTKSIGDDEDPAASGNVEVGEPVKQIAAGHSHTCALSRAGAVRCWGRAQEGQLGYGHTVNIGDNEHPEAAGDVQLGGSAVQIAAGAWHTCALLEKGTVRCWGSGAQGQLGYGTLSTSVIGDDETPAAIGDVNVGGPVKQLVAGGFHTCALLESGDVRCWGSGEYGELGQGSTEAIGDDEDPATVPPVPLGGQVRQLAAGGSHTCALLETGAVRCWGRGMEGQLGYGNTASIGDDELPTTDVNVGGGSVIAIAAGWEHTCAFLEGGAIRCWGMADRGQLGYGNKNNIGDDESPADAGDVP